MHCDGAEDIIVAINSTKHLNNISNSLSFLGGVLCAKASMLLQVSYHCALFFWVLCPFSMAVNLSSLLFVFFVECSSCGFDPVSKRASVRVG